ncbi:fumarylacetoacetate hydrolase family protein [Devosia sp.]|uniref:fumarylacetoacetate hydrolase family protein n=1 Tax=Devosia sp. TaxID=1871048 RepID=UPI003263D5B5
MTDYVIAPQPQAAVPVSGGGRFPVRRIFCVGRNYADHQKEMGHDGREQPVFFTKPADTLVIDNGPTPYPPQTSNYHFEIELVVAIGTGGSDIAVDDALNHVFGYGVGLDMTRRDLQAEAKKGGKPWDMAKGFDFSAPVSHLVPAASVGHPDRGAVRLRVNGIEKQRGDLSEQIYSVSETIAELSRFVMLKAGDLIMTGTPAGVGAVLRGDVLEGEIDGIASLRTIIV